MLVDSSVWIDFLRGTKGAETSLLAGALRQEELVWIAPPILVEILQGADSPLRFARWDRALSELPLLDDPDSRDLARTAAKLYAQCRWQGFTPRSPNDCLIAQYAVRFEVPLLHRDRDFVRIARIEPRLKLLAP